MRRVLFFFALILCFSSCDKKLPTSFYYLSDFERSFAKFQVGSYWIYQNDSTLQTDSIYVTSFKNKMQNDPDDDYENFVRSSSEYINIGMKSTLFPDSVVSFNVSSGGKSAYSLYYFPAFRSYFRINNNTDEIYVEFPDSLYYAIPHSTMDLNNITYSSVFEINNISYPPRNTYQITSFVTPNFGLIKWNQHYLDSTNRSESWSLLRCHMVW